MPAVNFIADPYAWAPKRPPTYLDSAWLESYAEFKGRLNWLLLWNDEVQLLDSFVLFNRQIERWIETARSETKSRDSLERLFNARSLRVALRRGDANRPFATLTDIDAAHIRGNPQFRWYYDGPPHADFAQLLDACLGLPNEGYSARYQGVSFGPKMERCFNAAFDRTRDLENIYDAYGDLREKMPTDAPERIRQLIGREWRRSKFYTILGFGIDQSKQMLPASPELKDFSDSIRVHFRRLVDSVWYRAIDESVGIATRYPAAPPPAALWDAWSPSEKGIIFWRPDSDPDADWVNDMLGDRTVGAAHISGDLGLLAREVAKLDVVQVCQLRDHSTFKEFRQRYNDFESLGSRPFSDVALLNSIAKLTVRSLRQLGQVVGVSIEESRGAATIRFLSGHVPVSKLFAYGLAIVIGDPTVHGVKTSVPLGLKALGIDHGITWLATKFQRIGIPGHPLQTNATYIGPIRSE